MSEAIAEPRPARTEKLPLAVDLDGTLATTDTLHESLLAVARMQPGALPGLLGPLRRNKAAFKRAVAAIAPFSAEQLPYNRDLLDWLRAEKATGRRIGLFTAADQTIADAVAGHLGLFEVVRGSDGVTNLSGVAKVAAIQESFGPAFAYVGDGVVDLPIFARAAGVVLAGPVAKLRRRLPADAVVEAAYPRSGDRFAPWLRAMRLSHWSKNALIFVPALLSAPSWASMGLAVALFVLFGITASATYVINDLLDLAADRAHAIKRRRPFAAGLLQPKHGAAAAAAMLALAVAASLALSPAAAAMLLGYIALTTSYSVWLKRMPMVDVTALAMLFTLRVLAGSLIIGDVVSPWLLTFSMLFFLGLAIVKRHAELLAITRVDPEATTRGYSAADLPLLLASGVGSGLSAIVIFMIYLITDQYPSQVYRLPGALWCLMPILLLWTLRVWHLAVHGRMNEDPVVFALRDRMSLAFAAITGIILFVARL